MANGKDEENARKEDKGDRVASGGREEGERANKAFKLLESQGIICGKTLGSGAYAKVKSAYDMNKKHKVAVKIINKKKASEEYLKKFLPREIEAMRILGSHYALVKFYQIIETTNRYFFIMELADKGDLLTTIKLKANIDEKQAGMWFINLHDGLLYMHGEGVVHRDIKCENLVIDVKNTLKLADFGFAKKTGKAKGGGPQLAETYCGSFAYAPPEILKGLPYDPEVADVWSMGVVLFTMLYGQLPFDDTDHKKLLKQVQSPVIFPKKPEVSEECRILMLKILTKRGERIPLRDVKTDPWFKAHMEYFEPDHPKFKRRKRCRSTVSPDEDNESDTETVAMDVKDAKLENDSQTEITEEDKPLLRSIPSNELGNELMGVA